MLLISMHFNLEFVFGMVNKIRIFLGLHRDVDLRGSLKNCISFHIDLIVKWIKNDFEHSKIVFLTLTARGKWSNLVKCGKSKNVCAKMNAWLHVV